MFGKKNYRRRDGAILIGSEKKSYIELKNFNVNGFSYEGGGQLPVSYSLEYYTLKINITHMTKGYIHKFTLPFSFEKAVCTWQAKSNQELTTDFEDFSGCMAGSAVRKSDNCIFVKWGGYTKHSELDVVVIKFSGISCNNIKVSAESYQ